MPTKLSGLPATEQIGRTLDHLLGRRVILKPAKPWELSVPQNILWGVYTDDAESQQVLWGCDLALAANISASLCIFPPSRVQECIMACKLDEVLEADFREVMNVLSQVLNSPGRAHYRLQEVRMQSGKAAVEITQGLAAKPNRMDLEATVTGYGGGRMIIFELSKTDRGAAQVKV